MSPKECGETLFTAYSAHLLEQIRPILVEHKARTGDSYLSVTGEGTFFFVPSANKVLFSKVAGVGTPAPKELFMKLVAWLPDWRKHREEEELFVQLTQKLYTKMRSRAESSMSEFSMVDVFPDYMGFHTDRKRSRPSIEDAPKDYSEAARKTYQQLLPLAEKALRYKFL